MKRIKYIFANYIEKVNGENNNFSCTKWFMQEEKSKSEKISENDCQKLIKSLSPLKENSQLERLLIVNKGKLKEIFSEYFLTIPEMVDLLLNGNYEGNWMYRDLTCKKEEKFEKSIISCFKKQQNNT
ncbi:hypothetical protein [Mycoplasma suis]|nr:hypothetical protein [Mycoplasma suis]